MSDQNQFDQLKQKALHYWSLFLAACGKLWTTVKAYTKEAAAWLRQHTKHLTEKLSALAARIGPWLKKVWEAARRHGKRLLQILAAWLLAAKEKTAALMQQLKEKTAVLTQRVGAWLAAVRQRFPKAAALPSGETADEQPQLEAPAESVEAAEAEDAPEAVEEVPAKEPAWKSNPALAKTAAVFGAIGFGVKFVVKWICRLYKVIMAAPVVWMAVKFAMQNMERLPEKVGLDIQSTGEFARMISRQQAVYWPLGITMFCLLLMFCSKKPILPWVISIFTLVLPWLIWILNYYA